MSIFHPFTKTLQTLGFARFKYLTAKSNGEVKEIIQKYKTTVTLFCIYAVITFLVFVFGYLMIYSRFPNVRYDIGIPGLIIMSYTLLVGAHRLLCNGNDLEGINRAEGVVFGAASGLLVSLVLFAGSMVLNQVG